MVDEAQPIPFDYNDAVFRHGAEARGLDSSILRDEHSDVHGFVADQLMLARLAPVLDIGCGPTKLGKLLDERGVSWMGVDAALPRLRLGTGPRVQGDALPTSIPPTNRLARQLRCTRSTTLPTRRSRSARRTAFCGQAGCS